MTGDGNPGIREDHAAPGVALRAARNAQNLSVAEVARQLRLSVAQIEALEASAFDRLPGPVFARGYLRNYAHLLKLDPEPLVSAAMPAPLSEPAPPIDARPRGEPLPAARKLRWPRYAIGVVGLALALAAYEYFLAQPSPVATTRAPDSVTVTVPAAPFAPSPAPARTVPAGAEGIGRDPVAGVVPDTTQGSGLAPAAVVGGQGSTPPAPGRAEILLNFNGDSWVEIRDQSGGVIFSQLNRRGAEHKVAGTPPLVVVVGNATAVRLTYNDRRVELDPYTKHNVARLTLE